MAGPFRFDVEIVEHEGSAIDIRYEVEGVAFYNTLYRDDIERAMAIILYLLHKAAKELE